MLTKSQESLSVIFEDELELCTEMTYNRIVEEKNPSGLKEFKLMEEAEMTSMVSDY